MRGNEKIETEKELRKEIEKLQQRISDLEKLQNKSQNVNEETERYPDPLEETVTTCTLEPTNVNEQLLEGANSPPNAEGNLFEIKRNYEAIGSAIPDAFIITHDDGRIVFWNKTAENMYGYSSEEVLNNYLPAILIPIEYHKAFKEGFAKFKNTGKGKGPIVNKTTEFINKKKDGSKFAVEMSLSSVKVNEKWHSVAIIRDVSERKTAEEKIKQSRQKLKKTLDDTVNALVKIIGLRDPYTSDHQKRVSKLAVAIARELELSEKEVKLIKIGALIHDIGKATIPMEILNKPAKLARIEYNLIRAHSQIGHDILKEINFPWAVEEIVLQHHERIDGSGYPRGLKEDEILIGAKIIAVADVVEAMSSHRPYRPALGVKNALEEISQNRGILYDPKVADTCLKLFRKKKFKF